MSNTKRELVTKGDLDNAKNYFNENKNTKFNYIHPKDIFQGVSYKVDRAIIQELNIEVNTDFKIYDMIPLTENTAFLILKIICKDQFPWYGSKINYTWIVQGVVFLY